MDVCARGGAKVWVLSSAHIDSVLRTKGNIKILAAGDGHSTTASNCSLAMATSS